MEPYQRIVDALRGPCAEAGFDLLQPLCVGWYNDAVEGPLRLEDFGSSEHLAVVIGNTRAVWPRFCDAVRREPALLGLEHPFDAYTERSVTPPLKRSGFGRACAGHMTAAHESSRCSAWRTWRGWLICPRAT